MVRASAIPLSPNADRLPLSDHSPRCWSTKQNTKEGKKPAGGRGGEETGAEELTTTAGPGRERRRRPPLRAAAAAAAEVGEWQSGMASLVGESRRRGDGAAAG